MYNPNEAREDNYILGFAALMVAILIAFLVFRQTQTNGLKHLYLKLYGEKSIANVINIKADPEYEVVGYEAVRSYDFKFLNSDNLETTRTLSFEITYHDGKPVDRYELNSKIEIIYAKDWPEIFLPHDVYEQTYTDAKWLISSIFVLLICVCSIIFLLRRYMKFRKRMKYY